MKLSAAQIYSGSKRLDTAKFATPHMKADMTERQEYSSKSVIETVNFSEQKEAQTLLRHKNQSVSERAKNLEIEQQISSDSQLIQANRFKEALNQVENKSLKYYMKKVPAASLDAPSILINQIDEDSGTAM